MSDKYNLWINDIEGKEIFRANNIKAYAEIQRDDSYETSCDNIRLLKRRSACCVKIYYENKLDLPASVKLNRILSVSIEHNDTKAIYTHRGMLAEIGLSGEKNIVYETMLRLVNVPEKTEIAV